MKLLSIFAFGILALSAPFPTLIHAPTAAEARSNSVCGSSSYTNSIGHCVHRPMHANRAPAGATVKCRDRTYSFSEHRRGTCSWHGGVAVWLP
jgi:hypothetical protein